MTKYLILAATDISKPQKEQDSDQRHHRNITIDDDDNASENYRNTINTGNNPGKLKFILKAIDPPSEEFQVAFEYLGNVGRDPKSLIGSLIQLNNPDSCRGVLLLNMNQCSIIGNHGLTSNGIQDQQQFDVNDELIEELLFSDDALGLL